MKAIFRNNIIEIEADPGEKLEVFRPSIYFNRKSELSL